MYINDNRSVDKGRWDNGARQVSDGAAGFEFQYTLIAEGGNEDKYQSRLLKPSDPHWSTVWEHLVQRLKTSCNLDDFSELNEAAWAMSKVFMPKRASVASISKFLGECVEARSEMLEQGLLDDTQPLLFRLVIEEFKTKIENNDLLTFLLELNHFPVAMITTDESQYGTTSNGRCRQFVKARVKPGADDAVKKESGLTKEEQYK